MPVQKQLSVFLPNRPGVLARACAVLSEADVNIIAMAVHDSVDHAIVRFLVDRPTKALLLLEQEGLYVMEQEVVAVDIGNKPGELARISRLLAEADINIAYAYCTAAAGQQAGCLVLRTDQLEKTLEILSVPPDPSSN